MTILLTGGTGKTANRLSSLLLSAKIPYILTSRRASPIPISTSPPNPTIHFDWNNPSTWHNPFTHTTATDSAITAIYLVSGDLACPAPVLNAFIEFGRAEYGVKRFVLCSGSSVVKGGEYHGEVWERLEDDGGLEWCVLRPSWFMENFSETGHGHYETITQHSKIFSACQDGKIPFVSASDIANVAFHALTDEKAHNCSYRILGPELLTYDQIAEKLSIHLGREITHVKLSVEQRERGFMDAGISRYMAGFLTGLETMAARGGEGWEGNDVEIVSGRKAVSFDVFVDENKKVWM